MNNQKKVSENSVDNIDNDIFKSYREIVNHTHQQIAYVRTAYKWLVSLVALVIIVGIVFTYRSVNDFKNELKENGERINSELITSVDALEKKLITSLNEKFSLMSNKVFEKIELEFESENIKTLIETQALIKVDEIAKPYIRETIENTIDPQIIQSKKKFESLEKEVNDSFVRLNAINEFTLALLAAQNDDREALEKLDAWANDSTYVFYQLADNALLKIILDHSKPFYYAFGTCSWPEDIDPSKLDLQGLIVIFNQSEKYDQIPILEYISNRKDIHKKNKMSFYIDVMEKSKSLMVVEYASRYFMILADLQYLPLDVDGITEWWDENKELIE